MKMQKLLSATVICGVLAADSSAQDFSVKYDRETGLFSSDTLTLENAPGGGVIAVGGEDGDVITVSGDTVTFDGDLSIVFSNQVQLVFNTGVEVSGDLEITSVWDGRLSWSAPSGGKLLYDADTTIFGGVKLKDYEVYSSAFASGGEIDGKVKLAGPVRDDGDVRSVQLQQLTSQHTKTVAIRLAQTEDGIAARKLYAKYILGNYYGEDFDTLPGASLYNGHYPVVQLTMLLKTGENFRSVRFAEDLSVGGDSIQVKNGIYAVCEKIGGMLDENGAYTKNTVVDCAAFLFESPERSFVLGGVFSGGNSVVGVVPEDPSSAPELQECSYMVHKDVMDCKNGFVKILEKTSLEDVLSVQAFAAGNQIYATSAYNNILLDPVFSYSDGWRYTCEFQVVAGNGAHLKGMGLVLKQVGDDIQVKFQYAGYIPFADYPEVVNPGDWHFAGDYPKMKNTAHIGDSNWADPAHYSLSNLVVRTRRPAGSYREIAVDLANNNTMVDSEFVLEGRPEARVRATLADKTQHPFPNSGKVMVKDDALLELAVSGLGNNEGFQEKGKAQIEIQGGVLHQLSGNQFTDLYRLKVNGGTLAFAPGAAEGKRYTANWKDANTYIGGIEYSNGAKTVGASPRMGLNNTGSVVNFSVSGNLPCRAEHGIDVVGVYTSNFIAFDIDDVTGNGETDFTMTGAVLPHSDGHRLFKVVKTGEGTLEFLGANDYTNYPTYVRGGTLRLGASGVMHEKMGLSLEGGSFAVAAGTSNILGRLAVSADADITVESAAELSFADSSDVAWGNDLFRLDIFQSEGASVRFGENASSLTQNQLRRIRLNGRTCKIDENGYLRQRMGPVIVIR